jgi:hypothetical protein
VAGGETTLDPKGAVDLLDVDTTAADDRVFRPDGALVDPNLDARDEGAMRDAVLLWVRDALAPALAAEFASKRMRTRGPLSFVLEVVFPRATDAYTIRLGAGVPPGVEKAFDPDYDALNAVAGSFLVDVIDGKRHWGEPLLAGLLRSSLRAYEVTPNGLRRADVAPMFVYYALSYEESMRRWVEHQLGSSLT